MKAFYFRLNRLPLIVAVALPAVALAQFGLMPRVDGSTGPDADQLRASSTGGLAWSEQPLGGLQVRPPWYLPLPSPDERLRRASYPVEAGSVRVVPTVIYLPDAGARTPGVFSVAVERSAPMDPVRGKVQLDWSGKPGGAVELGYRAADRQVALRAEDRPSGVAALPNARAPGALIESSWSERLDTRTTAKILVSGDRLDLDGRDPSVSSARLEVQHRLVDGWRLFAGVAGTSYVDVSTPELRQGTASLGTAYEIGGLGLSATVRDESLSSASTSGRGGRVSIRGAQGGWSATVFADGQQQATTIALDVRGQLDLPADLTDVGLVAARPEDAIRLLRDRSALLGRHDIVLGAARVDPLRMQGGLDVKWRDSGSRRTELGMRLAVDEVDGAASARRAMLGTLYGTWRVMGDADVTASYANWSMQRAGLQDDNRSLFRLSLRAPL